MTDKTRKTRSRFLRVKCNGCTNEQVIFGCASTRVNCLVCNRTLAVPRGGKTKVKTEILNVLDTDLKL